MGERGRDVTDLERQTGENGLEFRLGNDFFDREWAVAFHTGEVVEVFPNVVAFAFA